MAEHGAHLTSAYSAEIPTIFEVLAQDSLMSIVRPAVKHAVRVLAENRPETFSWLLQYFDELYCLLDFTVQRYYLQKYGASFAENFYDLKRVPANSSSSRLPKTRQWTSLVCLVLIPYVKTKVDQMFEDLRHRYGPSGRISSGHHPAIRKFLQAFLAAYPYVHMTWEGACLWYQLAYMLGQGRFHSPFLHLSGTELRRLGEDDLPTQQDRKHVSWADARLAQRIGIITRKSLSAAAVTVSTSLSVGVFFLQFLEWWYSSDTNAPSLTALPIPDPPQNDYQGSSCICPLCARTRTNDTALSVSGYVFCYPCIHGYIQKHGCCPVTGFPARTDHMIKLYPPDS
ncbi:peroxisome assembly protein 12-like [Gigantopelta aegis]|uniref:peroxisome assembly protein 12-like n=1 Tax=Gigantopelta aegis TaxID=1735272 RepID=UPI001B888396|nr:peroxisome assembly protein 12-like [Gigantopelta aegis]